MSEDYRPDGPTANKVRGMIAYENSASAIFMILAQEIDRLREEMVLRCQVLENALNDHADPDLVGSHYGDH